MKSGDREHPVCLLLTDLPGHRTGSEKTGVVWDKLGQGKTTAQRGKGEGTLSNTVKSPYKSAHPVLTVGPLRAFLLNQQKPGLRWPAGTARGDKERKHREIGGMGVRDTGTRGTSQAREMYPVLSTVYWAGGGRSSGSEAEGLGVKWGRVFVLFAPSQERSLAGLSKGRYLQAHHTLLEA